MHLQPQPVIPRRDSRPARGEQGSRGGEERGREREWTVDSKGRERQKGRREDGVRGGLGRE